MIFAVYLCHNYSYFFCSIECCSVCHLGQLCRKADLCLNLYFCVIEYHHHHLLLSLACSLIRLDGSWPCCLRPMTPASSLSDVSAVAKVNGRGSKHLLCTLFSPLKWGPGSYTTKTRRTVIRTAQKRHDVRVVTNDNSAPAEVGL